MDDKEIELPFTEEQESCCECCKLCESDSCPLSELS